MTHQTARDGTRRLALGQCFERLRRAASFLRDWRPAPRSSADFTAAQTSQQRSADFTAAQATPPADGNPSLASRTVRVCDLSEPLVLPLARVRGAAADDEGGLEGGGEVRQTRKVDAACRGAGPGKASGVEEGRRG